MHLENLKISIIGLGYVGLPLAVAFGRKFKTLGYDTNGKRVTELSSGYDRTKEISTQEILEASLLAFSNKESDLESSDVYILALPTPVNSFNVPDFSQLVSASQTVGKYLPKGNTVVYESTVYPGATEEVCVPELERTSGLKFNSDFYVGYSPERISPGGQKKLKDIIKLTSGSTLEAAKFVDMLYQCIIDAGTYMVSSLKVAEASKVLENSQRDI